MRTSAFALRNQPFVGLKVVLGSRQDKKKAVDGPTCKDKDGDEVGTVDEIEWARFGPLPYYQLL